MYNAFRIQPWTRYDKSIIIYGPEELRIIIDHDDVDTFVIDELALLLVGELNFAFDRHEEMVEAAIERGNQKRKAEYGDDDD